MATAEDKESELTLIKNASSLGFPSEREKGTDPNGDVKVAAAYTSSGANRAFEKSPAIAGSRALAEEDAPRTTRKGQVTPRDGLAKLTRMNNEWLLSDETGKHMSPILWARLRKPFISYVCFGLIGFLLFTNKPHA